MSNDFRSPTRLPIPITRVLSWVYRIGIGIQNLRYDRGIGVNTLDRPVISIGNLSAGGTGKTPMVHWVMRSLIQSGHHPAIAMRGYGFESEEIGDEEQEHRDQFPDRPIIAQPNRYEGLIKLFAHEQSDGLKKIDCVVLDDGFQHRKIARDFEIVLIDVSRPPDRDALLPRGFLRESIDSLKRANAIVLTRSDLVNQDEIDRQELVIKKYAPQARIYRASHRWDSISRFMKKDGEWVEIDRLDSEADEIQGVLGICAIGNPDGFFHQIEESSNMELVDRIAFKDHDHFDAQVIQRIETRIDELGLNTVCMTQKDWVKVRAVPGFDRDHVCVLVPNLVMEIQDSSDSKMSSDQLCDQILSVFQRD